ncbi:ferritin-like domain-containing protein [Hydrogenimonas cancrithermarum]|uniref:DUF2202 domain-containing protein n=1 Tax=Hydrogenimonas cancrithermarum TaxID=2993563 RepID=A0ABN6WRY4_9BACT|nr:DUF2202 domain-containing protein [Hydrogenimonas cancrithermarum]BDY11919.1 hypothetical protein HCR_02310 [Hydrogenimonas cancrithermarum]
MKKKSYVGIGASLGALLLVGCGGGSSDTASELTGYDLTVERGPVLHAFVIDSRGKQAVEIGNGHYLFAENPEYPVSVFGGFIDLNRDGTVSAGDINNSLILKASAGNAATLVNTIALREEIRSWLKESFGLDDETIDSATPSTDRSIAAISDELFAYCIEQQISDPSALTLQELEALRDRIQSRIESYLDTTESTADLEIELVEGLDLPLLTEEESASVDIVAQTGYGHTDLKTIIDQLPVFDLNDEQKYALAYMWNEEKLAKDIYLALNDLNPHQTLYNIATRSETEHEAAVEALVQKYDINITNLENYEINYSEEELRALAAGEFAIPEVQELYNALYEKGTKSLQDALKVGCMVEVTDVADLDKYIETADGAEDLVQIFTYLRSGSYNHYWAFDSALKSLGVTDGCCSLGETYCKTEVEFPMNNNGRGH